VVPPGVASSPVGLRLEPHGEVELELELIQSHMAQKPVLRGEVAVAMKSEPVVKAALPTTQIARICWYHSPSSGHPDANMSVPTKKAKAPTMVTASTPTVVARPACRSGAPPSTTELHR